MKNIFLFGSFLIFIGCAKPPDYPIEPVIEFVSLSTNFSSQPSDNGEDAPIVATFTFTDGDGDLGDASDTTATLKIIDLRDNSIENSAAALPEVPESGANNGISGEMYIRLLPTCCIIPTDLVTGIGRCPTSNTYLVDTLVYEVYIIDRAGNESNRVKLDPIYISCN